MAGNVSIRDNVETCRIGMFVFIRWIKLNTHNKKEIQVFLPVSLLRSIHSYTKICSKSIASSGSTADVTSPEQ